VTTQFFLGRIPAGPGPLADLGSAAAGWALWLRPPTARLEVAPLRTISEALRPLREVIWHTTSGGSISARVREHKRAFGNWPGLTEGFIARGTYEGLERRTTAYSDVAWVAPGAHERLQRFLYRNTAGLDSALAYIPDNEEAASAWANAALGLHWLWLCRSWTASSPRPPFDAPGVLRSYVGLTLGIGGVAALMWEDLGAKRGLVFLGSEEALQRAAERLAEESCEASEETFAQQFRRGARLAPLPWGP
jgi:hypothetical protein